MLNEKFDYVIFGAGIYGLYAAKFLGEKGYKVALIEIDSQPLQRASYINQARVHNGYHYPRSVSTAIKSAQYYNRFNQEFAFAIHKQFRKVYAISMYDSLTNAEQFLSFCNHVGIAAEEVNYRKYFNAGTVECAFETDEYTYDAVVIKNWFMDKLNQINHVTWYLSSFIRKAQIKESSYLIELNNGRFIESDKVLNATYASVNQILSYFGYELFKTKYELCEVILTDVSPNFKQTGITVMDGPFFSLMPFGFSGKHSLTSVFDTPHETSKSSFPDFSCQSQRKDCDTSQLQNCNSCLYRPVTAWPRMKQLTKKYLNSEIQVAYHSSLFAVKTILDTSEIDDSRPTIVKFSSTDPIFISVLSGKFNTIYDLEEVLK
ncbi:FAD-dependent oxidoreductase [Paenibacillus sp. tmac-D7]|uniref:FAD-dependent oxidoreductase n=1 Tax=Paenibacillus sp. tmac-D7 TaxID=2591462 RepID=UPI001143D7C9|nr:FAD-dependent oxidoreductase [Paenibacillus sp. tmac-D7]